MKGIDRSLHDISGDLGVSGVSWMSWQDHITCWTDRDGWRLLLSQPYPIDEQDIEQLNNYAEKHGLTVRVGNTGWYGHGTVAVEVEQATSPVT